MGTFGHVVDRAHVDKFVENKAPKSFCLATRAASLLVNLTFVILQVFVWEGFVGFLGMGHFMRPTYSGIDEVFND